MSAKRYTVNYAHLDPTPPPGRQACDEEVVFASDYDDQARNLQSIHKALELLSKERWALSNPHNGKIGLSQVRDYVNWVQDVAVTALKQSRGA